MAIGLSNGEIKIINIINNRTIIHIKEMNEQMHKGEIFKIKISKDN